MFYAMAMIYAIIIKERKGFYGNTDYRKVGDILFKFEMPFQNRFM